MVKLLIAVKRNPRLTLEQFREHLSTQHARLVKACPASGKYLRKYVQSYAIPAGFGEHEPAFDGAAELYFDDIESMNAFFSDPDYLEKVRPDEARFADIERCAFYVTDERQII